MDPLTHFYNNGCLFKCDALMFNDTIKSVLTNLLTYQKIDFEYSYMFKLHDVAIKCIICTQIVPINNMKSLGSSFLICKNCCNECTNKRTIMTLYTRIFMGHFCLNWDVYDNYVYLFVKKDVRPVYLIDTDEIKTGMINNSHKLRHRYYHTIPIMFIMSISDNNSHCNELNLDAVKYILSFIY